MAAVLAVSLDATYKTFCHPLAHTAASRPGAEGGAARVVISAENLIVIANYPFNYGLYIFNYGLYYFVLYLFTYGLYFAQYPSEKAAFLSVADAVTVTVIVTDRQCKTANNVV